jgi:hypothetical protein
LDYSCCELVGRCPEHPRSMRRLQAAEEEWSMLCIPANANVCYAALWLGLEHMVLPTGPMWSHT